MASDRINIFPSRANLVLMKYRTVAATRGLNLLKRKRDAIEVKLRDFNAQLRKISELIEPAMSEAKFSIAKANFLGTDLKPISVMNADRADVSIRINYHKMVGILLPSFELVMRQTGSFPLTGLSHGGVQVEVIRTRFRYAIKLFVELASLRFTVKVLENCARQNNMRINGLEYVVIPRIILTCNYIRDELEEYEREEFYRLKRSQAKQRKAKESFAILVKEKEEARQHIRTHLEAFSMEEFERLAKTYNVEESPSELEALVAAEVEAEEEREDKAEEPQQQVNNEYKDLEDED